MSETTKHVDELTMMRLADGELSREREGTAREHLIECARCRSGYEALKAESELLRAAVREQDEALPDHIRPRHADVSWVLVATLVFGTLGVSSLWTRYVDPMFDSMETVGIDGTSVATTVLIRSLLWRGWSDMFMMLIQGAVLLTAVILAGVVLYWTWRRLRSSTAILTLVAVAGLVLVPAPRASAAVIELEADAYTLREGEIVDNDLIIAGRHIRIEGTITGDLIVAANTVEIPGEVQGDVLGFAESIEITGRVGGNVRTGSRRLDIEGAVGRNITAGGESVRLLPGASLGGSVIAGAREAIFDAAVPKDIIVGAETSEIHARIGGSALLAGERLTIGPTAAIGGEAKFYGANEPEVDPEAELAVPIDFQQVEEERDNPVVAWISAFFYFWTAAFIFGAAVMLLTPDATEEIVTRHVPEYGRSFVTGVLSAVVLFALGVFVTLTLVGAPLGITTLFLLGVGLYFAQVYVAAYIGREILGAPTSASESILRLALGLLLLYVAKSVPVLSFVVVVVVALWGFGALTAYLQSRLKRPVRPAEATA